MFFCLRSKLLWIVLCAVGLSAGCGELRPTHEDAKQAFAELVQVQQAHQASVAELAIEEAPHYQSFIEKDTSLTLQRWRLREQQFRFLIDNDPDRLRLRRGREGLVTFHWSPQDSSTLANSNPLYRQLEQEVEVLEDWIATAKVSDPGIEGFYEMFENTVEVKSLRRVYGRDEQAIVLRYRLAAILKEE